MAKTSARSRRRRSPLPYLLDSADGLLCRALHGVADGPGNLSELLSPAAEHRHVSRADLCRAGELRANCSAMIGSSVYCSTLSSMCWAQCRPAFCWPFSLRCWSIAPCAALVWPGWASSTRRFCRWSARRRSGCSSSRQTMDSSTPPCASSATTGPRIGPPIPTWR